jgi:hypothetical protein
MNNSYYSACEDSYMFRLHTVAITRLSKTNLKSLPRYGWLGDSTTARFKIQTNEVLLKPSSKIVIRVAQWTVVKPQFQFPSTMALKKSVQDTQTCEAAQHTTNFGT